MRSAPMIVSKDQQGVYELIGNKPHEYGSKKKLVPGMYFSSVVMRKDIISFYFMPLYYHHEDYAALIPTLGKSLKGKICFNFRKEEQISVRELERMLKKGMVAWKKNGYML